MSKYTEAFAEWQKVIDETVTNKNTGVRVGGAGQKTLEAILEIVNPSVLVQISTQEELDAFRPESGFAIVTMGDDIDTDIKAIFGTDNNKIEIHAYTIAGTGTDSVNTYQEGVSAIDGKRYRRLFVAFDGWGDFEINEVTETDLSQKMQYKGDYDAIPYANYLVNDVYSWRGNLYIVNTPFITNPQSDPEDIHNPDDTNYWTQLTRNINKTVTTVNQLNDTSYVDADNMILLLDNRLGGLTSLLPSTHNDLSICRMEINKTLGVGGMQFIQNVKDIWGTEWQRYTTWSDDAYEWSFWSQIQPTAHASSHTNGDDDIQLATSLQKGLLSSTDWNTFNSKEPSISKSTGMLSWTGSSWAWITTTFQDASKLVTSWSATVLNTNYPSEKLVKDSLDAKENISNKNTDGTFSNNVDDTHYSSSLAIKTYVDATAAAASTSVTFQVRNSTGSPITDKIVYLSGATGQMPNIALASNDIEMQSDHTIGFVSGTLNNNTNGIVYSVGLITGKNTSAFNDGDLLWLGTNGSITNVRPVAPLHAVFIGVCAYSHSSNGKLLINIVNGYELGELHDVDTSKTKTVPLDADYFFMQDTADSNIWKKVLKANLNEIYVGSGTPSHNEVLMIDNSADLLAFRTSTSATIQPNFTLDVDKYTSNYAGENTVLIDFPTFDTGKNVTWDNPNKYLALLNLKASDVTFVLSTGTNVFNGITYTYKAKNLDNFVLSQNKSAEVSYFYLMTSATTCDVWILWNKES